MSMTREPGKPYDGLAECLHAAIQASYTAIENHRATNTTIIDGVKASLQQLMERASLEDGFMAAVKAITSQDAMEMAPSGCKEYPIQPVNPEYPPLRLWLHFGEDQLNVDNAEMLIWLRREAYVARVELRLGPCAPVTFRLTLPESVSMEKLYDAAHRACRDGLFLAARKPLEGKTPARLADYGAGERKI